MPNETRVKPASRSEASVAASTSSGLASVVTSAPGVRPKAPAIAARIAERSAAGSSVGVPPPKNTVSTTGASAPNARRASPTSAMAAPA